MDDTAEEEEGPNDACAPPCATPPASPRPASATTSDDTEEKGIVGDPLGEVEDDEEEEEEEEDEESPFKVWYDAGCPRP